MVKTAFHLCFTIIGSSSIVIIINNNKKKYYYMHVHLIIVIIINNKYYLFSKHFIKAKVNNPNLVSSKV